jgi:PAS domain S-box-containing protein
LSNETARKPPLSEDLPISPGRLLEESPNGWVLTDATGIIRFVNARTLELFGYTRDELMGERVEVLVPDQHRVQHVAEREGYMVHPTMRPMGMGSDLTARRKDGTEFPVDISLSPIETPQGVYVTSIIRDISERVKLERERNDLRLELEMERERDRIGMDLHDGILQEIYAAGLTLDVALGDLRDRPDAAEAEIERSISQLHDVIRNIRSYIFDLRPRQFGGSLPDALAELAREFRQNALIEVLESVPDLEVDVAKEPATAAYHIVHEALSNVRKHAEATRVSLRVSMQERHVLIEVMDNGRGFDMTPEMSQVHRGLRNMAARAGDAGCELDVQSKPGEGTCVTIRVPVQP